MVIEGTLYSYSIVAISAFSWGLAANPLTSPTYLTWLRFVDQFLREQNTIFCKKLNPKFISMNSSCSLQSLAGEVASEQMSGPLSSCKRYKYLGYFVQGITTVLVKSQDCFGLYRHEWKGFDTNCPVNSHPHQLHSFPCSALPPLPSLDCLSARACDTTEV